MIATNNNIRKIIELEINKKGADCSLNHIDVSKVTNFTSLFKGLNFTGSFNKWDVSNIIFNKKILVSAALFNQDISGWLINK